MDFVCSKKTAHKLMKLTECGLIYRNKYIRNARFSQFKGDLSERQFSILILLTLMQKNTISELAKFMNVSKSALSIVMNKLVKKGYVQKVYPQEIDDKRKIYFYVSNTGKEILKKMKKANLDEFRTLYQTFDKEQKEKMNIAIEKLEEISKGKDKNIAQILYEEDEDADEAEQINRKIAIFFSDFFENSNQLVRSEFNINGNESNNCITKNQFHILYCIENFNYNTVSKLESFLNSSGSTVSITISKLVKDGYLYKDKSTETDKRIVYIKLTGKGIEAIKKALDIMEKIFVNYIESLSEKNKVLFNDAIECLLDVIKID